MQPKGGVRGVLLVDDRKGNGQVIAMPGGPLREKGPGSDLELPSGIDLLERRQVPLEKSRIALEFVLEVLRQILRPCQGQIARQGGQTGIPLLRQGRIY